MLLVSQSDHIKRSFSIPVFSDSNKIRIFLGQFLHLFEHIVLSGIDVNVEIVSSVEQSLDETLQLANRATVHR
jgi:hypothetical protein